MCNTWTAFLIKIILALPSVAVAIIGDVNGAQTNVLILGTDRDNAVSYNRGSCDLIQFDPYIHATSTKLSQSAGGSIQYNIDFPYDAAGHTYQFLASMHGVGPTMLANGVQIPLTLDSLLAQTYVGQLPPIVQNGIGTLDGNGSASIQIVAPAGAIPASLIGVSYAVAVATRYAPDQWRYSSVAVRLTMTP